MRNKPWVRKPAWDPATRCRWHRCWRRESDQAWQTIHSFVPGTGTGNAPFNDQTMLCSLYQDESDSAASIPLFGVINPLVHLNHNVTHSLSVAAAMLRSVATTITPRTTHSLYHPPYVTSIALSTSSFIHRAPLTILWRQLLSLLWLAKQFIDVRFVAKWTRHKELYIIDQSWRVRRWDLQKTIKAMPVRAHVRCICLFLQLEAALHTDHCMTPKYRDSESKAQGAICSAL